MNNNNHYSINDPSKYTSQKIIVMELKLDLDLSDGLPAGVANTDLVDFDQTG